MSRPAISDVITIVGSAYLQPIADLLEKLLERPASGVGPAGVGDHENGYSAALVVLLVAMLESYTARLRFVRKEEAIAGSLGTPELLARYFPDIPYKSELIEVFLVRNVLAHNHVWHLNVSNFSADGSRTLATPKELDFQTNKQYDTVVDVPTRRTRTLLLNVDPTSVDRSDVRKIFDVVWRTLQFMSAKSFSHTPLGDSKVVFRRKRRRFEELLNEIRG